MQLEQTTANTVAKYQSRTCTATFTQPTKPGSLLVVVVSAAGTIPSRLTIPSGFLEAASPGLRDIQMSVYYRQNAPATSSVSVTALDDNKSLQVRAFEYSGMAASNVVDKIVIKSSESVFPFTGLTANTSQADELVMAFVVNQYASTTQFGFSGALVKLFDTLSPQNWSGGSNQDFERSRLTVHQVFANSVGAFSLSTLLSCTRRWLAVLITFRGGSLGPIKLSSTTAPPLVNTNGGKGSLSCFGKLSSGITSSVPPLTNNLATANAQARIGPFNYQYRLGGWSGLLIGDDTPYTVEKHDGLEGWQLRTSDDELPRGDGSLRGVDLESSRQILFELKVGSDSGGVVNQQLDVENALDALYRTLVPQRDQDWELIWRHPGRPLRMVRVRPIDLVRELSAQQTVINDQKFGLLAADPRHYSAFVRNAKVLVTPAGAAAATPTTVINQGNGFAYPEIRINGPVTGPAVTRIELTNTTLDVGFVVEAVLPFRSTLIGDMEARATGASRSVVTIDGQSKYGAWQHPRTTFPLGPGANALTLETVPAGAPVTCTLTYRDTWSG